MARKISSNERLVTGEVVSKHLWSAVEIILPTIKQINDNPTCLGTRDALWANFDALNSCLRHFRILELESVYKVPYYDAEALVKFQGYIFDTNKNGGTPVRLRVNMIACQKAKFHYNDCEEIMLLSMEDFDRAELVNLTAEDLPLYVGWEFKSELYAEMLKKGVV